MKWDTFNRRFAFSVRLNGRLFEVWFARRISHGWRRIFQVVVQR